MDLEPTGSVERDPPSIPLGHIWARVGSRSVLGLTYIPLPQRDSFIRALTHKYCSLAILFLKRSII